MPLVLKRLKKNIIIIAIIIILLSFYALLILTFGNQFYNEKNETAYIEEILKNSNYDINNKDYPIKENIGIDSLGKTNELIVNRIQTNNKEKNETEDNTKNKNSQNGKVALAQNEIDIQKLSNSTYENGTKINKGQNYDIQSSSDNLLNNKIVTICEKSVLTPPEAYEGYNINCPVNYELSIDDVFFGRRKNDTQTCNESKKLPMENLFVRHNETCEYHPTESVRTLCNGHRYCNIKVSVRLYYDPCRARKKYMEVKYHCVPVEISKKKNPKFAVVMFSDSKITKKGSIYDMAINDFRNYTKANNYEFFLGNKIYDRDRQVYYMKLYTITEYIIKGLKEESYDWILWVDGDVVLVNPYIELSAFIPPEDQDEIHFIIGDDFNGINAGVFLIRVHQWSLSFMMRASSYSYYKKDKYLPFADQSSINNVLKEDHEDKHYIVVPQTWFNSYYCFDKSKPHCVSKGDFLVHFAGLSNKERLSSYLRKKIQSEQKEWTQKTTFEMRKSVLEYYALPREKQHHLK